jgi:hypothetical protein
MIKNGWFVSDLFSIFRGILIPNNNVLNSMSSIIV